MQRKYEHVGLSKKCPFVLVNVMDVFTSLIFIYIYIYTGYDSGDLCFVLWMFFRKQFTVGVLTATSDLAALVLVGVAAFFGSEVVLAPFGSLHVGGGVLKLFGVYIGVIVFIKTSSLPGAIGHCIFGWFDSA